MKLHLSIQDDTLNLLGAKQGLLPIDRISSRFNQAKRNCQQAGEHTDNIFVGAEHLAYLKDKTTPFILIEKSPDYYQLLLEQELISAHPKAQIIWGDLGFAPPTQQANFSLDFLEQDMLKISIELLESCLKLDKDPTVFWIWAATKNNIFDDFLYRTILTTLQIASIHRLNRPIYDSLKKAKGNGLLALHRNQTDGKDIRQICEFNQLPFIEDYSLDYPQQNINQHLLFKGELLSKDDLTEALIAEKIQPYVGRYNALLDRLTKNKPAQVCQRNRSIYGGLEDYLLLHPIFNLSGIDEISFWIDYQQHQFSGFEGGFLHSINDPKTIDFSFYTLDVTRTGTQLYYYPPPAAITVKTPASSLMKRDIAIIHHTRPNAFLLPQVNLLFNMLNTMSSYPIHITYFAFFDACKAFFDAPMAPFKKCGFWQHLLNFLHFAFYHQVRVHWAKQAISTLSSQFSIKIYGPDWPHFISPEFCEPYTNNPDDVYASSLITLDLTPLDTYEKPPLSAMRTLCGGGVPVLMKPAYTVNTHLSTFNEESFVYVPDFNSVINLVCDLKVMPGKRAALRDQQLLQLQNSLQPKKLDLEQRIPLKKIRNTTQSFSGSNQTDNYILYSSLGIFLELSGYYSMALDLWKETQENIKICHQPLVLHALALSKREQFASEEKYWADVLNQISN